jgi:3-mercaptopropionate dioxygenase
VDSCDRSSRNMGSPVSQSSQSSQMPLRELVTGFAELLERAPSEAEIFSTGGALLSKLVADDHWLPAIFAAPDPQTYQQYLLYCDGRERFSVVSFVWGPGQSTPIHDHTVWGLIGMLRGAELSQRYRRTKQELVAEGPPTRLEPGDVEHLSPTEGDIHRVANAFDDRPSISIHIYGANIGAVRRSVFDASGSAKAFISGYANSVLPNIWSGAPDFERNR